VFISRRSLLSAGAAGLASVLPSSRSLGSSRHQPDWSALSSCLDGSVELPGTDAWEQARRLVDPRFDAVRPPAVVRCAHAADVAESIRFAVRSRLPVVVRGGGHSYVGASVSDRGVVLDVRGLDSVRYDPASRTAVIGGGARLIDIYNGLGALGVSVPSGSCGSVGIGGIAAGGGVGMASSAYGMTCDVVIAATVVGADGRPRTVHAHREPDLFWALRGGGGGPFGVVTAWRMRTHPVGTVGTFVLTYPWARAAEVAAGWQARLATAPDETWSACQFASDSEGRLSVRISGVALGGDAGPEVAALAETIGLEPASAKLGSRPYLDVSHDRAGCTDATTCAERGTELAGSDVFRTVLPPDAVDTLLDLVRRRSEVRRSGIAKLKRMTGAQSRVAPGANAFPWRGAQTMLQWLVEPAAADTATVRDGYDWIDAGHRAMAPWSAGRYVNYLEPGPVDPALYHGPQLARLRQVRAAVDPHRLFRTPYSL
jgi:FAD/FMN-containing dehydrogenase